MPAERNRRHILVPGAPSAEDYSPHPRKIEPAAVPVPASRPAHGAGLRDALMAAVSESAERRQRDIPQIHNAVPGIYVQFESQPGIPLQLTSLEDRRQGIELAAVTYATADQPDAPLVERATVFVPDGKVRHFLARFERYSSPEPKAKGERRHEGMIDPIATLRLATLRGLWTDTQEAYPAADETIWWEMWLRRWDDRELERLLDFASQVRIRVSDRRLQFDDRIVALVEATATQLAASVDVLSDLAELRRAKQTTSPFVDTSPVEQTEWAEELAQRTTPPAQDVPAVCVLDTGVTRGHLLLSSAISPDDCHACEPTWGTHDDDGHGTEMAGLALYGDLAPLLASASPVSLRHRVESVKILPPPPDVNEPQLYGAITAEAASRVEVQAPDRSRCFSMAITTVDTRDRGQPTSWSAAIDALAAGRAFDPTTQGLVYLGDSTPRRRLFLLSAGNLDPANLDAAHLDRSDLEPVHDPGQAWNALTVGAFTEKAVLGSPDWNGWSPVARPGDLSPWSTTSVTFDNQWPIKPDVVFEGGNVVKNANNQLDYPCPDVVLLSTHYKPAEKMFVLSWATSAATAQAARLAAEIWSDYPDLPPEAVRGLIVHSAEWTREMQNHLRGASGKRGRSRLVRRYGFGVPNRSRALRSAADALTLVASADIRPFVEGKMREIHFFELPWPRDVLQSLGSTPVTLRVTLSYFVEPNPSRRGWRLRHRYASHGLRFAVKGPTETLDEFRKRLNQQALDEDERRAVGGGDSAEWYLGEQARNRGSIHSDMLQGFAADVAERGVIGVYPVSGWWKDQPRRDRSALGVPYSLIVSLETEATDIDIWTPVANQVQVPVEIVAAL